MPSVIESLESWIITKGSSTHIPPAFYDRDGSFVQPPSFEMPAYVAKGPKTQNGKNWLNTKEFPAKVEAQQ